MADAPDSGSPGSASPGAPASPGSPVSRGCLLVASPLLADPNFARAVVLIITHDLDGTFGLVLNRPLDSRLADVLPEVDALAADIPVMQGGPVQMDVLQFVARDVEAGRCVLAGVSVGASLPELIEAQAGEKRARAFLGYAGWGTGQLERETAEGSWIVAPARAEHVFEVPTEHLWSTVLRELGGRYAWMSLQGGSPEDN
jgi:putative transcriptional regulator